MAMDTGVVENKGEMRPVIVKSLAVCLAIAVAPWLSGGQEPLAMLISGFALLLGALLVGRQPEMRRLARGPLVWTFCLLIGLAGLSLLWTANSYSSVMWIVEWVMTALVFRLSYAISASKMGREWVAGAYVVSAGVFSAIAIGMYLTSEYGRLTGTFYWANPAAAYLIPAVLMGMDRVRAGKGRAQLGWSGYLVLAGTAFLLTDSRAAMAVLAVVVIIYLAISKLNKRFWIHFLFSALLAYGLSIGLARLSTVTAHHAVTAAPGSRFGEAIKGESTSGKDRLFYLGSAVDMWMSHPWGGVGAGAYGDVHPQYQKRVVSASTNAHNAYVQIWAELGIVGGLLLLGLLVFLVWGSMRGLLARPGLLPVALGTLGVMMHAGLDIDVRYPALLGLLGMLFGLMYVQKSPEWVKPRWLWPAVTALVLIPVVSLFLSSTWTKRAQSAQIDGDFELAADEFGRAGSVLIYNPDVVGAEGINLYVRAQLDPKAATDLSTAALERAHRAEALDPRDAQHHQLEGRVLQLRGDYKGAESAFRRSLELDPYNHPDYALDLAGALVRQARPAEAAAVAEAMLAQYPPDVVANRATDETVPKGLANLYAIAGNIYLQAGELDKARVAADKAVALDPQGLAGRALKHQVEAQ